MLVIRNLAVAQDFLQAVAAETLGREPLAEVGFFDRYDATLMAGSRDLRGRFVGDGRE
jgi:hypothetical protein